MRDLAGRTALITGASRSVGRSIAEALAAERMNVVVAARSRTELDAVAEQLRARGVKALPVAADVGDPDGWQALVETATAELGAIDVLVNNAAIEVPLAFDQLTTDDISQVVEVDLVAPMVLTRLVLPAMLQRGRGHIVNVASMEGKFAIPYNAPYVASKAGLIAFTRGLRIEVQKSGVGVSVVCPTYVSGAGMWQESVRKTGATDKPPGGTTSPEKIAEAVVRAIKRDVPEVLSIPQAPANRLILGLMELFPGLHPLVMKRTGVTDLHRQVAQSRARERTQSSGAAS
jgi:short-subunit dehydrogenase